MFVDFCAFPASQMELPVFAARFPKPAIVGYTACPPIASRFSTAEAIIAEVQKTVGVFEKQEDVLVIQNIEDLDNLGDRIGVVLGLQLPPMDANIEDLKTLRRLGILFTTLAYKNEENPYGGGYMTTKPLTEQGKKFLRGLAVAGIVADLSHACHQTARETIEFVRKNPGVRIMASHGGCHSVYNNPRNLPDDILSGIARFSGIVGVYNLTFGLSQTDDSLNPWLQHVRHMIEICGLGNVSLGTDGIYRQIPEPQARTHFERMKQFAPDDPRWPIRFPVEPVCLNSPLKAEIISGKLTEEFRDPDTVKKITANNALHFLRTVL